MRSVTVLLAAFFCAFLFVSAASAQIAEICGESGATPWMNTAFVYGRVTLNGFERDRKLPKITVTLFDRNQSPHRYTIDRSGAYCFRGVDGSGGFIVIDIEGTEVLRRSLPMSTQGIRQHSQDFEISPIDKKSSSATGVISARYVYERPENTSKLFNEAVEVEKKDAARAIGLFRQIVETDKADFITWAKLGNLYYEKGQLSESESAYKKALAAKSDYLIALLNLGRVQIAQKKFEDAVEILKKAAETSPTSARAYQLLGEAYLLVRKGTLGVEALNKSIELDPVGMAESHLMIATLYDRAGAKPWASREYALFLKKVPDHPDRKTLEKYIKDNPEQ